MKTQLLTNLVFGKFVFFVFDFVGGEMFVE